MLPITDMLASFNLVATSSTMRHNPKYSGSFQFLHDKNMDYATLIVEATLALYWQFRSSTSTASLFGAFCSYYHAVSGCSVTGSSLRLIHTLIIEIKSYLPWHQSGTSWIDVLDGLYKNTKRVVKSALGEKLVKVFNHIVALAMYKKAGIELDPVLFGELEKKRIRPTVWDVASFADAITGLVLFLCKAGRQAIATGSVECFFIDEGVLSEWVEKASRLRKDYEFTGNPAAVGMALPAYINSVKECITTGKELQKHFRKGRESTMLLNIILELETVLKRLELSLMASAFRRAPIGVFLYGGAGVAKSHIALGLFNHYCAIRGIDKECATMWTRTENEEYYSGYKSHYAGVLYDDASKYRVSKVQGIDPSIGDIISAINNIQFVTPQADLPDKGKIPFRAEWVGVTSNVDDLNANYYFNCTGAFLRRFAVRITPEVKPEFCLPGERRIDPAKIPAGVQYPDLWVFNVDVPFVEGDNGHFRPVHRFEHYADLLEYMTGIYERHIEKETRLMESVQKIGPERVCECKLPVSLCRCVRSPNGTLVPGSEDGTLLFGTFNSVAQADVVGDELHWDRVNELQRHKHVNYIAHGGDKVLRAFLNQTYADPLISRWFDPHFFDGELEKTDEEVVQFLVEHIDKCVEEFIATEARDRLNFLSDGAFTTVDDSPDMTYLTFEPKFDRRGFFIHGQMSALRAQILQFAPTLTDKEVAVLDVYLEEEAPRHISDGWSVSSIIRGGHDYVKFYSSRMVDTNRAEAREFLLGTRDVKWYERFGVWFAGQYFERPWVYHTVNYVTQFRLFQYVASCFIDQCAHPRSRLMMEASRIDKSRLGGNVILATLASVIFVIVTATLVSNMYTMFVSSDRREFEATFTCTVETEANDLPQAQMDLESVGKRPVPRETDRANVWVVKERAITRLDVDPKRPHNDSQLMSAIKNNLVFCRVYSTFHGRKGYANTRAIVVDNETIVVNNHAFPAGARLEVWLGPVHEEGVRPSYCFHPSEELVKRIPERDVAIIKTWANPCRFKDIKHLFTKRTYTSVGPAEYLVRRKDHTIESVETIGVTLSGLRGLSGAEDVVCEAWSSHPLRQTVSGECGSPLVVHSTLGSVVVGFHSGYDVLTNTAWAVRLYREDFDDVSHPEVGIIKPCAPVAQVGGFMKLGPNDKLYTDYHRTGHIMTHGQVKGFVARPKFTGTYTPHAYYCFDRGSEFDPPITDNMAAPRNAGWKQPQMVLENYLHPTHSMNEMIVRACVKAFKMRILNGLSEVDLEDIHPVPISVAVNGMPRVPNVDAQKHSTSAGHGKRGPKLQYLSEPIEFDVWDSYREFDKDTLREIDEMREQMYRGIRPHAIYDACWKNEMLSKAKVEAGRARCIYMCPLAFLVNMRMSTVAMCRVMIRRRLLFCIAVGLNTHSEEWDDLYQASHFIPGDNWIAGDFKAFESVLGLLLSNAVSKIIEWVALISHNYSDEEMMALRVELADISNATINFFGELITLLGGEASGQQLTTFFNCIANILLHMYAYVVIHSVTGGEVEFFALATEFFVKVFCMTLGDDVYLKVHPDRPEYNHTRIQQVFADIGITYTMADKEAVSRPYVPLGEVTFLKRKFEDHEAFPGMKVATLDKKSIYKMLCYTVPSHSVSAEEQMASAIASAQAEAFFHGSSFFAQIQDLIAEMPKSRELEFRMGQLPAPSWNGMMARFIRSSPKLQVRQTSPVLEEKAGTEGSYCHASALELQTKWRVDPWGSTVMERSSDVRFYGRARLCANKVPRAVSDETTREPKIESFSKNINKINKKTPTTEDREMAPKVVAQAINKVRTQERRRKRSQKWSGQAQADIQYDTLSVPNTTQSSSDHIQEQVVFKNEPEGMHVPATSYYDDMVVNMELSQTLGKYFMRPKLVFTYSWVENTASGFKTSFNPWQLFFAASDMKAKLEGYGLMRCKLVLKFLINGSPFYYGSMMAAYHPLSGWRADTAGGSTLGVALVPVSQRPHVWLENQNSSTATLELPFLYPMPFLDTTSTQRLADMGRVDLYQYATLLSANGTSSTPVDIQVYAWAEDIVLAGPTNRPVAQSEFVPDGQISGPAAAVAASAAALSKVPVIGPYAMATSQVAKKLSSWADYFGFTNVPNVRDVSPMKQVPFSLASTDISEPVQKLSLHAKAETAVGAEQHGGPSVDEMAFNSFLCRRSFLVGTDWLTSSAIGEPVFTTAVSPQMFQRSSTQISHTPVSYAANLFQYWRGSLKYTFRVIRSPYHRGRLQISWDSRTGDLSQGGLLGNANTINTIMDLDEESECSFVVPYARAEPFQETYSISNTGTVLWSTDAIPGGSWARANGILSVRVLNRLTAPEASSSVEILVFVEACEDFEFAGPRDYNVYNGTNILSLSTLTTSVAQADVHYDDEVPATNVAPGDKSSNLYKSVFGERVVSFRDVLHRSSLAFVYNEVNTDALAGLGRTIIPVKRLPPAPGVYNNGWWSGIIGGNTQRLFYTKFHPLLAIGSCFVGYKGSVNVTVNVDQPVLNTPLDSLMVYRVQNGSTLSSAQRSPQNTVLYRTDLSAANATRIAMVNLDSGRAGMALTNTKTNSGMSVQLPYYSETLFTLMNPYNEYNNQDTLTDANNDWWNVEWRHNKPANITSLTGSMTSVYYASGPDFDFVYFLNVPTLTMVSVSTP
nr:MAG: capsid protein [Picornavirales sp.]